MRGRDESTARASGLASIQGPDRSALQATVDYGQVVYRRRIFALMTSSRPPESMRPLKNDVLMILLAVADRPRHGYGIMRDVEDRSGGEVRLQTGALYRALRRMLDDGLLEECDAPPDVESADARRRYYRLTRFGAAVLTAEVDRMAKLVRAARLTALGKRPRLA